MVKRDLYLFASEIFTSNRMLVKEGNGLGGGETTHRRSAAYGPYDLAKVVLLDIPILAMVKRAEDER